MTFSACFPSYHIGKYVSDLRRCKLYHRLLARKGSVIESGKAVIIWLDQKQSRLFCPQGWLSWAISGSNACTCLLSCFSLVESL